MFGGNGFGISLWPVWCDLGYIVTDFLLVAFEEAECVRTCLAPGSSIFTDGFPCASAVTELRLLDASLAGISEVTSRYEGSL